MRGGLRCRLVAADPSRLGGLRDRLQQAEVATELVDAAMVDATLADETVAVSLVDFDQADGPDVVRRLALRRADRGDALAALCRRGDHRATSRALATGCDDVVLFPLLESELRHRIEVLARLAALRRERIERDRLLAAFRGPMARPAAAPPAQQRARVLLVGPPSALQVGVADALGFATVAYADEPTRAAAAPDADEFDLVMAVAPSGHAGLRCERLDLLRAAITPAPLVLVTAAGTEVDTAAAAGVVDVIRAIDGPQTIRARVNLWLAVARTAQALRRSPDPLADHRAVDAASGLFNDAFLESWLEQSCRQPTAAPRALVGIAVQTVPPDGAPPCRIATQRLIGSVGAVLKRETRAGDLTAHAGGGRFVTVLSQRPELPPPLLAERLLKLVAVVAPAGGARPTVGASTSTLRPGPGAMRTVERLLKDALRPTDRAA